MRFMRFMQFSYYKTANYIAPYRSALLLVVQLCYFMCDFYSLVNPSIGA